MNPTDSPWPKIKEPADYYRGFDAPDRVLSRNVLLFERRTRKALQTKKVSARMHHRYVLMRALETPGLVSVDGQTLHLEEGSALLVTPYQFHHYLNLANDKLHWLFITFELEKGASTLRDLRYRVIRPSAKSGELWLEVANLWIQARGNDRLELLPLLDQLLTRIHLDSHLGSGVRGAQSQLSSQSEWIVRIEDLIFRSIREGWTLAEVARRANISERHLRHRFEAQMGMSLRDYRSSYQFHTALSLMRNPQLTLFDVAELSGFHSQSVFTHFIRRMSRKTPSQLRKELREEA